jgi:hypothetical protein
MKSEHQKSPKSRRKTSFLLLSTARNAIVFIVEEIIHSLYSALDDEMRQMALLGITYAFNKVAGATLGLGPSSMFAAHADGMVGTNGQLHPQIVALVRKMARAAAKRDFEMLVRVQMDADSARQSTNIKEKREP